MKKDKLYIDTEDAIELRIEEDENSSEVINMWQKSDFIQVNKKDVPTLIKKLRQLLKQ